MKFKHYLDQPKRPDLTNRYDSFCKQVSDLIKEVKKGSASLFHPHSGRELKDMPYAFTTSVKSHNAEKNIPVDLDKYYIKKQEDLDKSYLKMIESLDSRVIDSDDSLKIEQCYIPKHLLLWIVDGFGRMSHFDHKKNKMILRKPKTVRPFLEPVHAYVRAAIDALQARLKNQNYQFRDDALNLIFKQEKFPRFNVLYNYFYKLDLKEVGSLAEFLEVQSGSWRKFCLEDLGELFNILKGMPPLDGKWCIQDDEDMLEEEYLSEGPIYIFFSDAPENCKDQHISTYGFPRIFVATVGDEENMPIAIRKNEIGGISEKQGMDSVIKNTRWLNYLFLSNEFKQIDQDYLEIKDRLDEFNYLYKKYKINGDVNEFTEEEKNFIIKLKPLFFMEDLDERVLKLQIEVLKSSSINKLEVINKDNNYFERVDLQGVNFGELDLQHTSFKHTDLRGANFSKAKLIGTNFEQAIVDEDTKFPKDFKYINNFNGSYIMLGPEISIDSPLYFQGVSIMENEINLQGANLTNTEINFFGTELKFTDTQISDVQFKACGYGSVDFASASLHRVSFDQHSNLQFCIFKSAILNEVSFRSTMLFGTNFESANLENVNFDQSNLRKTNFESATLNNVTARGADLTDSNISIEQLNAMDIDASTHLPNGMQFDVSSQSVKLDWNESI